MASKTDVRPSAGPRIPDMKNKNVVMASHGRAPWYGPDGKVIEAYVIGIAGGSASGKVSCFLRITLSSFQHSATLIHIMSVSSHIGQAFQSNSSYLSDLGSSLHSLSPQQYTYCPHTLPRFLLSETYSRGGRNGIQE